VLCPGSADRSWFRESWAGLRAHAVRILAISAALLVPCFWTKWIAAGDLASHLYNAWLVRLIEQGKAPGLWLAIQWTNVLFDDALAFLLRTLGPWPVEHIAVAGSVLLFFWGAFAFLWTLNRRAPWTIVPCLAMLAYGYVFHAGFFNYYISLGIALILCAIVWHGHPADWVAFVIGLVVALLAHPVPVIWAVAFCGYVLLARRISPRAQWALMSIGIVFVIAMRGILMRRYTALWTRGQLLEVTGADQLAVFGRSDWILAVALLVLWCVVLVRANPRWRETLSGVPAQLFIICAAIIALLPGDILISPERFGWFSAASARISLLAGVLACALVGTAQPRRWHARAFAILAAIFFAFVYVNYGELNRLEGEIDALVQQLPPDQRVLSYFPWQPPAEQDSHFVYRLETSLERIVPFVSILPRARMRWTAWHLIDRACIGRCFSYGNYEPATGEFRVRASPGNPIVIASGWDTDAIQRGRYRVRASDLPLFLVYRCNESAVDLCLRGLREGELISASPPTLERHHEMDSEKR
jgi:hypothetical protein